MPMDVGDIEITPLKRIATPGGEVMHGMKCTDEGYLEFGEVYFSIVKYEAVKAWKKHKRMTLNLVVPTGRVRFVFYDEHQFREIEIGRERYARLTVPPGLWFGFKGVGEQENIIMNVADIPHDPDEIIRCNLEKINYDW